MLRTLLSLLVVVVIEHVCPSSWEMVEVTLASEYYNNKQYALDDFNELFDEFAQQQGIRFNKRNFREIETFISGLPVAKYGLRGVDCEQFRRFLSVINAQKYHLQYAAVKCGPMTFSFCMAFSCSPDDFFARNRTDPFSSRNATSRFLAGKMI